MPNVIITGNLGKDAEYKTTQGGSELCYFTVADKAGYGDNEQTLWFDVTRWGKGAEGLSRVLRKGSSVTVIGELSTREHNGKTYLQCRAHEVKIQGTPGGNQQGSGDISPPGGSWSEGGSGGGSNTPEDLDDDIPF